MATKFLQSFKYKPFAIGYEIMLSYESEQSVNEVDASNDQQVEKVTLLVCQQQKLLSLIDNNRSIVV